jgi:hypothetical protein
MINSTNTARLTATALQMTAARVVRVLSAPFRGAGEEGVVGRTPGWEGAVDSSTGWEGGVGGKSGRGSGSSELIPSLSPSVNASGGNRAVTVQARDGQAGASAASRSPL